MKKIMILAAVATTLAACNSDEMPEYKDPNVIYMTAGVDAVATTTRSAVTDFPNQTDGSAKIAVVARYIENDELATDWNSPYIDHQPATVGGIDGADTGYNFTWTTQQYWPVGGNKLQFIAYSPVISDSKSTMTINTTDNEKLDITLPATDTDMPDIIVANKNAESNDIIGFKKNSTDENGNVVDGAQDPVTINFQLKHILSQLDVKIKGSNINSTNAAIVSKVQVIVAKAHVQKTFDMKADLTPASNAGWTAGAEAAGDLTYEYTNSNNGWSLTTSEITANGSRPILLFPNTQASITIRIFVKDSNTVTETQLQDIVLSSATSGGSNANLVTGKKTTLTVTIAGTDVVLSGAVTGWTDLGNFGATIH